MSNKVKNITGNRNIDAFLNWGERTFDAGADFVGELNKTKYQEHGKEALQGGGSLLLGLTRIVNDLTGDVIKHIDSDNQEDNDTPFYNATVIDKATEDAPQGANQSQASSIDVIMDDYLKSNDSYSYIPQDDL